MTKEQKTQLIFAKNKLCEGYVREFGSVSTEWERLHLTGIIYRIVNLINGKSYIGQTINWFNDRYANGKWYIHTSNRYLKYAIEKYGIENFSVLILDYGIKSIERLNELEIKYIDEYKTFVEDGGGYNLTRGGDNKSCAKETKIKISKAMIGRKFSKDTLEKMSKAQSGENNPNFGKPTSQETKDKISKFFVGKKHPNSGRKMRSESVAKSAMKHKIAVNQLDKITGSFIKKWDSAADAGRSLLIERSHITCACKGKYHSAGKFKWEYSQVSFIN